MESNEVTKFRGLLKVLDILYLVMIVFGGLAIAVLTALAIFVGTHSEPDFTRYLSIDNTKISYNVLGVNYHFTPEYIAKNVVVDKEMFFALLLTSILTLAIGMTILWFARKLINNFKNNHIFTVDNGKYIEFLAILFLVIGHLASVVRAMTSIFMDKTFKIGEFLTNNGVTSGVGYNMFNLDFTVVLFALTIWFIGRAFKFGAFLQDEYNGTV